MKTLKAIVTYTNGIKEKINYGEFDNNEIEQAKNKIRNTIQFTVDYKIKKIEWEVI